MILILASLDLKTTILSRYVTMNYIVEALAFVLRNPESQYIFILFILICVNICIDANMSESHLYKVKNIIIPQICRIRNCGPLKDVLSFTVFSQSDSDPGLVLDFFDVVSMDRITDGFKTKYVTSSLLPLCLLPFINKFSQRIYSPPSFSDMVFCLDFLYYCQLYWLSCSSSF